VTQPRDLRPFFDPRSVAVVGASNDPAKWGQWLARGALAGEERRDVYLVNRSGGEILGRQSFRSLDELPEQPELVVLAVPASTFEDTVDAALAAGARGIIAIAAGLGELSAEGLARERQVAERVRAAGALLLGPNCLGVYDGHAGLDLASADFRPGPLALVSQSGNLALEIGLLAGEVGIGVSRFASVGNQADVDATEVLASLAAHEPTRAVGVYCEDFRDGRAFARAAQACIEAGTPVLLLAGGMSVAGKRAARSHTGALVSDSVAVDAACRAAGILRVSTPQEMVDLAQLALATDRPQGVKVAIVTDGGGSAVVAADLTAERGLELPRLSPELAGRLAAMMPATASTENPVDFAGAGEQDLRSYERIPRLLLESGEVDTVLLTGYLGGYSATADELREPETDAARGLARAAAEARRPVVVQTMYGDEAPARALREAGIPVYRDVDAAVSALAAVAKQPLRGSVPELPSPVARTGGDGYFAARELLAEFGVPLAAALPAVTPDEAAAAAAELGYPVALKALGLVHKSDAGGVALGLRTEEALVQALGAMQTRLAPSGYAVERMSVEPEAVELIVGCRRDTRFGPVLLVGLGGILAEVLRDTAVVLAPTTANAAEELLLGLVGAPLLTGARGRRPLAVRAAAEAAAALSVACAAHEEIGELEVNPLLVTPTEAIGLDARLVYSQPR